MSLELLFHSRMTVFFVESAAIGRNGANYGQLRCIQSIDNTQRQGCIDEGYPLLVLDDDPVDTPSKYLFYLKGGGYSPDSFSVSILSLIHDRPNPRHGKPDFLSLPTPTAYRSMDTSLDALCILFAHAAPNPK